MVIDDELKKRSEQWKAFAKDIGITKERALGLIESDTKSLIHDLAMAFPDKISQIVNLAMLIELTVKSEFKIDLALLIEEVYRREEESRTK
jgi:hypothetical protein